MRRLPLLIIFIIPLEVQASVCTGRFLNPITDLDWSCLFPITIGDIDVTGEESADKPDTDNPKLPICDCIQEKTGLPIPGIAIGFWEPVRMVDVTKRPFCMVNMGGVNIAPEGFSLLGTGAHSPEENHAVWHLHWFINPVVGILNLFFDLTCLEFTSFDLAYLTEFDPLFHDDELAFILNPEAILFANPIAQAACAADCVIATSGLPSDSLFWCAGCQGGIYPFNGNNTGHIASIQSTSLTVQKFIAKQHRSLQLWETSGEDALCHPIPAPIVKKSQYRLQTTYPVVGSGRYACNPFGKSTVLHDSFKEIPVTGEDFGYFIWRKRNCCFL